MKALHLADSLHILDHGQRHHHSHLSHLRFRSRRPFPGSQLVARALAVGLFEHPKHRRVVQSLPEMEGTKMYKVNTMEDSMKN